MNETIFKGSFDEKKPMFVETKNSKQIGYDGKMYYTLTNTQLKEIHSLRTEFIQINKTDRDKKRNEKGKLEDKTLNDLYEEFVKDANELKSATNGLVNMYKTGRDAITCMKLAYHFIEKNNIQAEPITNREYEWLEKASIGALIFAEPYRGTIHKFDINSSYAHIYSNPRFIIPIQQGEFKHMTQNEFENITYYQIGIYRVNIKYPDNNTKWHKIFKLNDENYYTHIDVSYAKKLGLTLNLIEDGDNWLFYSRTKCKAGSELFGEFVKLLYPLRQNVIIKDRCKSLLRALWGVITQKNEQSKIINPDEEYELHDDKEVINMVPYGDTYKITYIKKEKPYSSFFARMKSFLLAQGRKNISQYIEPYADYVVRSHTDSINSSIALPIPHSLEIGMLKNEGIIKNAIVMNSNRVIDIDDPNDIHDWLKFEQNQLELSVKQTKHDRHKY